MNVCVTSMHPLFCLLESIKLQYDVCVHVCYTLYKFMFDKKTPVILYVLTW